MPILRLLTAAALVALADLLLHAGLHLAAARARRQAAPFSDEPPLPFGVHAAQVSADAAVGLLALLGLPFALRSPRGRPVAAGEPVPVLLVHGYAQNPACFLWLRHRLRRDGRRHVYTVGYRAVLGDIERGAIRLGHSLDRLRHETGAAAVDVVAHSMGGLVVRAYLRARGSAAGIRRLVTLGTPHQGTEACAWLHFDPLVRQMRPGSPLLVRLAAADPVPDLVDVVAVYSADDPLVVPASNGYYAGAFNIEVRGVGHLAMLASRRVYQLVRENLDAPLAGREAPDARPAGG